MVNQRIKDRAAALEEKTEGVGGLQSECKIMGVEGSNTFEAYLNGIKYLMAIGKINIADKEVWKSIISGL